MYRHYRAFVIAAVVVSLSFSSSLVMAQGKLSWGGLRYSHEIEMDLCGGAAFDGTVVHIGGQHLLCPAGEMVLPGFGSSGAERFETLESATNPGTSFVRGVIGGVTVQTDGRVLYAGDGETKDFGTYATAWFEPDSPFSPGTIGSDASFLTTCSANGVLVGKDQRGAVVGSTTQPLRPLPNGSFFSAIGVTADAKYIISSGGVYSLIDLPTLQYGLMDPSHWDQPDGSLGFAGEMDGVVVTPNGYFFAANDLDANFSTRVVVWNEAGKVVGITEAGDVYAAIASIDGVPVLAVEGVNDSYVYPLGDFGNPKSMAQLTGNAGRIVKDCVCDDGGFGCVLELGNGSQWWVSVTADADATPAPLKVQFIVEPGRRQPVITLDGKGNYEFAVLSASGFDARQIDTKSVRVVDARDLSKPSAPSLTPSRTQNRDVNRDRLQDKVLAFSGKAILSSRVVTQSTTELAVFGLLRDGRPFIGVGAVQVVVPNPKGRGRK